MMAEKAIAHTEKMSSLYRQEIARCIEESTIYGMEAMLPPYLPRKDMAAPTVVFANTDSVSALFEYGAGKTAILNFASYKEPGGSFIRGGMAQEESLCHESFLYNVLRARKRSYYAWNNKHKNRSLYLDRALFSPKIVFEHDGRRLLADVITCAAPNYSAAKRYKLVTEEENLLHLKSRIAFVRDIAEAEGVRTLIAGAFGCGVFGQDPKTVAKIFRETFARTSIVKIVYAVPGSDGNAAAFEKMFSRGGKV